MAAVEAFIWHDQRGNIVAVGHIVAGHGRKIEPLAKAQHKVLKLHVPEEHLQTLHITHTVDFEKGILRQRQS